MSDKGVGDGIDLTAMERIELGVECFAEVITVAISSNPHLRGVMDRPSEPHRNGAWIICLCW